MIHKYNIAELSLVDRPVEGPDCGFRSIVQKHQTGHDKNWRETSQAEAFGYEQKPSAAAQTERFKYIVGTQGGLGEPRPFVMQGVKCLSGLTGERYQTSDP